jgi:hypothetical protein
MDKTRSYAWENPRKVMEDEISGLFSPVTGARSHDLNLNFGFRGDHGVEIHKTRSPLYIRDKLLRCTPSGNGMNCIPCIIFISTIVT